MYAAFAVARFRETYDTGYETERLERHIAGAFSPALQRAELEATDRDTLVLESDRGWEAFVVLHREVAPPAVEATNPIEIGRFYVHPDWHGRGVAGALMEYCATVARAAGHDALWLCVWEHNGRAQRFYEKTGFVHVGTHPFVFGGIPDDDRLYVRSL